MNLYRIVPFMSVLALLMQTQEIDSQTTQNPAAYNLKVSVDEVELTFHASDARGFSVNDIRLDELRVLDNDRPPRRTVLFETLRDLPISAGILIDTSSSMEQNLSADQAIAAAYVRRILQQKSDQTFVMDFGRHSQMRRTWSSNPDILISAIHQTRIFPSTTAIFDTVYAVCRYQFGKLDHAASGNFILLFSDGEDDASFLSLQTAVNMCSKQIPPYMLFTLNRRLGRRGLRSWPNSPPKPEDASSATASPLLRLTKTFIGLRRSFVISIDWFMPQTNSTTTEHFTTS